MELNLCDLSQSALAYLGDSVMELLVRTKLVQKGYAKSKELNSEALRYVTAKAQAQALTRLLPYLTSEEEDVYRRGKNSSTNTVPKNATHSDYKKATGLEALFGYLYLAKRHERIDELFSIAYPDNSNENNGGN